MIKMVVGLHRNAHVNVDLAAIKHNIAVELARMDEQQERLWAWDRPRC